MPTNTSEVSGLDKGIESMLKKADKQYHLTEEQKNDVAKTLENLHKSEDTNVMQEIANNPDNAATPTTGKEVEAKVAIDLATGHKTVLDEVTEEDKKEKTREDVDKMLDGAINYEPDGIIDPATIYPFNQEDVKEASKTEFVMNFEMSDQTAIELVKLLNLYHTKSDITFNMLPEEIKDQLNDMIEKNFGISRNNMSVEAKTTRNIICDQIMEEYWTEIQKVKTIESGKQELQDMWQGITMDLSPAALEATNSQVQHLKDIAEEGKDSEDPAVKAKAEKAASILSSINEAWSMDKFAEACKRIRVKKFDIEKPQKIFNSFLSKYRDISENIFDIFFCTRILHQNLYRNHIIKDATDPLAIKIMICFCKYCQNMSPLIIEEHAFMYYFTLNIITMMIYKGEEYDKYSKAYFENLQKAINNIK